MTTRTKSTPCVSLEEELPPIESRLESTRERLLRATEQLVALHGVDGVTTRQISTAAETELGSIHHYFGTKDRMVLAVREWRVDLIHQIVQRRVAERRRASALFTVRDLAEFLVLPFVEVRDSEARNYIPYFVALTNCRRLADRIAVDTQWTATMLELCAEACPQLGVEERRRRLALLVLMTIGAIAGNGLRAWLLTSTSHSADKLVDTLVDCVAASFAATATLPD